MRVLLNIYLRVVLNLEVGEEWRLPGVVEVEGVVFGGELVVVCLVLADDLLPAEVDFGEVL